MELLPNLRKGGLLVVLEQGISGGEEHTSGEAHKDCFGHCISHLFGERGAGLV